VNWWCFEFVFEQGPGRNGFGLVPTAQGLLQMMAAAAAAAAALPKPLAPCFIQPARLTLLSSLALIVQSNDFEERTTNR